MTHAGIRHEAFEVALRKGHHRAIDDPNHSEHESGGREFMSSVGKEWHDETQEPVGTGLQQQAGQDDASGG